MQENNGITVVIYRNLVKHICMIHMHRIARAGVILPVSLFVVITRHRIRHRTARGKHALLRDL